MSTEGSEPERTAPTAALSARFSAQRREGTRPELTLRKELHRRGFRYRIQYRVDGLPRRRVDIAFPRQRVAVFVDGCFWHGCPEHCVIPTANRDWWLWKFEANTRRDEDTNSRLENLGWTVVRIWEHTSADEGADMVARHLAAGS